MSQSWLKLDKAVWLYGLTLEWLEGSWWDDFGGQVSLVKHVGNNRLAGTVIEKRDAWNINAVDETALEPWAEDEPKSEIDQSPGLRMH